MIRRSRQDVENIRKYLKIGDDGELLRIRQLKNGTIKYSKPKCKENKYGYVILYVAKKHIGYHVLVWILSTGKDIPQGMEIDHINGNKVDNKIENLRVVTHRQNTQNFRCHREGGICGACFHKKNGKYHPNIWINGKRVSLGYYDAQDKASKAYKIACRHIKDYVDNASFRELVRSEL